jgi:hypothetical protein
VRRLATWMLTWVLAAALGVPGAPAQEVPPSEVLLPATTAGFIAVPDLDRLEAQWGKTQVGQLMADPVMKPFAEDLDRQLEEQWASIRDQLGISLDDVRKVRGGEVAVAQIQPAPKTAAHVLLIDVTGRVAEAKALLAQAANHQIQRGARQSQQVVGGVPLVSFDLPPDPNKPQAPPGKAAYFLAGNLMAASDHVEALQGILVRFQQRDVRGSVASLPGYRAVVQRCQADPGAPRTPQLRWFIQPVIYAEVVETLTPKEKRRKGKSLPAILRSQGFEAVEGAGGVVDLAVEGFEVVHRTAVHAPPPYEKAMKMVVLPPGGDFAPQPWVPRDVASYSTAYADILNAFDNFDSLFDELFGQGETGIWQQTLKSMKTDPNGPQIDLRADLIVHLGQRVTMISDYQLPITPQSERLLFAVECRDPAAVAATIARTLDKDPTAKRRVIDGQIIWEIVEEEVPAQPKVKVRDIPSFRPLGRGGAYEEDDQPAPEVRILPHAAVTVAHGHLLVASHLDFLLTILQPRQPRDRLAADVDYRLVTAALDQLGIRGQSARTFTRTEKQYRPSYELLRQNRMPESEMLFGRAINWLLGSRDKGAARESELDGGKLPDYDVVRRYLGPAGTIIASERDGWFAKGVTLTK